ncbi:MAG: type II toxin-antitoxin system RelE/ParE family toxin [Patescibacteria group bacterium]
MEIVHYVSPNGKVPTLEYLNGLIDKKQKKKIYDDISRLEIFGQQKLLAAGKVEKIKGYSVDIWELKTSCVSNMIYRTLFGIINDKIIILNIFNKKEMRIRRREIAKSISRLKQNI